jgi:hypothetical protein
MKSITLKMITVMVMFNLFLSCISTPESISDEHGETQQSKKSGASFPIINYGGVYFVPYGGIAANYIRFFEDGTVINATVMGTPDKIKSWFNKDSENVSIGTFDIDDDHISFIVESPEATVSYSGKIIDNGLLLNSLGSNGHETKDIIYVFYKW